MLTLHWLKRYHVVSFSEVLRTCTLCTLSDADDGDEMRAKVNVFSKMNDISMNKAETQKGSN